MGNPSLADLERLVKREDRARWEAGVTNEKMKEKEE